MRLATQLTPDGPRLCARTEEGLRDVGRALGDERLSTMRGFLACGDDARRLIEGLEDSDADGTPGPVVPDPAKIVCLGRNYSSHADEMGHERPAWPEVFLRVAQTVLAPFADIALPPVSRRVDYEGELAAVIGRGGRHIPAARALEAIGGYCVLNDVTVRDWQHRGQQWTPGKNFPATLPLGPELVTADELDPSDLALETRLNGEVLQSARTSQMIFDIPAQIEFISSWVELEPGDVIATGTPAGVGVAREPPRFLEPGDVVEVSVESVGTIRNRVVADGSTAATRRWSEIASEATSVGSGGR